MRLPRLTYTTASGPTDAGTEFDLSCGEAFAWDDSLMGWEWSMDDTTGQATRKARKLTLGVAMASRDEAASLLALADIDARNGVEGTLAAGEGEDRWELRCGIMSGDLIGASPGAVAYKLTLHAVEPVWRRTRTHVLLPWAGSGSGSATTGLDLGADMPFDLAGTIRDTASRTFDIGAECLVGLRFYGPCANPYATVTSDDGAGGSKSNVYGVNATCEHEGDRIVVDPLGRGGIGTSVYMVEADGSTSNLYDSRRRGAEGSGSYIFERMPAGAITVAWPQSFGVDVVTIEERGALPWS